MLSQLFSKSPHENEENGVKLQFDSLLILMFHWPMITLRAESLGSFLEKSGKKKWFCRHRQNPLIYRSSRHLDESDKFNAGYKATHHIVNCECLKSKLEKSCLKQTCVWGLALEVRSLLLKMSGDRVDGRKVRLLSYDVNVWEWGTW